MPAVEVHTRWGVSEYEPEEHARNGSVQHRVGVHAVGIYGHCAVGWRLCCEGGRHCGPVEKVSI